MIKAIIFDFFGVICSDEYWKFVKEDKNMGGKFGHLADDVNIGRLSWQQFMQRVADETGQDVARVKEMYESERINPELVDYIARLHKKYKTALLTNAHADFMRPMITSTGLDKIFNEIVISSEVGIIKPDPRIYEHALSQLGAKAEEAVFIDDSPVRVDGAKAIGMKAIWYQNFGQMKTELEKLLQPSNPTTL